MNSTRMHEPAQQDTSGTAMVLSRPKLTERQLSDPIETFFHQVPDLSEADEFHIIAFAEDYDLARFELLCRIFAKHAEHRRLKDYLARYNRLAAKNTWRTIPYTSHAYHMAQAGRRFNESDKRMTVDFPLLPHMFFLEALAAGPGDTYFHALTMAHDNVETHDRNPKKVPVYTRADFHAAITPPSEKPKLPRADNSGEENPLEELFGRAREELGEEELQDTLERVLAGETLKPIDIEGDVIPEEEEEEEEEEPEAITGTCYDCSHCQRLADDQRLSVVMVSQNEKAVMETLGILEPCPAWFCAPKRQLISVRTQQFERAQALAGGCVDFDQRQPAEEPEDEQEEPSIVPGEESITVDDLMADEEPKGEG